MFLLNIALVFGKTTLQTHHGDLALNISRDNKIGICPNYLRMSVEFVSEAERDMRKKRIRGGKEYA